jgi:hypothetical protein
MILKTISNVTMMEWLPKRVKEVEEASKRYDSLDLSESECGSFLKAFEKQLHNQLHLKNLCYPSALFLPIKKGCYQKVEAIMKANQVEVFPGYVRCECAMFYMYKNKLTFGPASEYSCKLVKSEDS